ncbi:hypothetical protein NDU88_006192 [Pleurodeles waltl]|uniref:Uncharacterized protein n=1 Tax=Pleurodeles waltl TaxID=8319 RepID=A0AAV7MYU7_PLEWA|nr:hypothetical protein NDU88_006192 [Pleurodeles waltl]
MAEQAARDPDATGGVAEVPCGQRSLGPALDTNYPGGLEEPCQLPVMECCGETLAWVLGGLLNLPHYDDYGTISVKLMPPGPLED